MEGTTAAYLLLGLGALCAIGLFACCWFRSRDCVRVSKVVVVVNVPARSRRSQSALRQDRRFLRFATLP